MNVLNFNDMFLLDSLSEEEKNKIISGFNSPILFSKGDIIYSAENFSNALGYITEGSAVAVTNNGDGVYMNSFSKNSCFGAAAIFGGGEKYVSTIIATSETSVLFITEIQLLEIFKLYPKTYLNYITFLSNKVRFLNNKLSLLTCSSAEDTVLKYLSSVTDFEGYAKVPKSMTLLSKTLGIGRATLYRCLESLEKENYILRENNKIRVIKNEKNS